MNWLHVYVAIFAVIMIITPPSRNVPDMTLEDQVMAAAIGAGIGTIGVAIIWS